MTPTMMWLTTFKSAVASSRSKLGATRSDVRCRPHTPLAVIYEASCQAAVAMLFPCKTRNRCPKFLCSVIYVLPRPSSYTEVLWSGVEQQKQQQVPFTTGCFCSNFCRGGYFLVPNCSRQSWFSPLECGWGPPTIAGIKIQYSA
jgi:hypothetical protein